MSKSKEKNNKNTKASAPVNLKQVGSKKLANTLSFIVAIFAFLLYANTLKHEYALDDYSLILENIQTQKGFKAIPAIFKSSYREGYLLTDNSLYRPLSKAMFAAEWQLAPKTPSLNHFINVLFYALTAFLLFRTLLLYLKNNLLLSFAITLLFIAHPIHTEVIANIKSRDEIMGFFFFLLTAFYTHKYIFTNNIKYAVILSTSFLFSLFSKESSITFLAVIPLLIYFFTETEKEKYIRVMLFLIIPTMVFFSLRYQVIGSNFGDAATVTENVLVKVKDDYGARLISAIYFLGLYIKLFIWPNTLSSDHSYADTELVQVSEIGFIISFLLFATAGIYALYAFKKKDILSFAVLFFFITISVASNIITLIGTALAERLTYAPLLCFSIVTAVVLAKVLKSTSENKTDSLNGFMKANSTYLFIITAICTLYSIKTISRNREWHDNLTLYTADVINAPKSVRAHFYLGNHVSQDDFQRKLKTDQEKQQFMALAMQELNKALEIYPNFADAISQLGKIALGKNDLKAAAELYQRAIKNNPVVPLYHSNYGAVLFKTGDLDGAMLQFQESIRLNPSFPDAFFNLGAIYGEKKRYDDAINMFKKAIELQPNYASAYYFMGITYRFKGDEVSANKYIAIAQELDPAQFKK